MTEHDVGFEVSGFLVCYRTTSTVQCMQMQMQMLGGIEDDADPLLCVGFCCGAHRNQLSKTVPLRRPCVSFAIDTIQSPSKSK